MSIYLYTDGAAKGNPGNGGYGVVLKSGHHYKEMAGGFRLTTNNRMELLAVIIGLEEIKKEKAIIQVYSDSKYVHLSDTILTVHRTLRPISGRSCRTKRFTRR